MKRPRSTSRAILLASAAAAIPVVLANLSFEPAVASAYGQFEPPSDPMVLTRTLRRPLSDGAQVLTRRSYEIRFIRESDGYRVDGRLLDVEVDAPPKLRALALLERNRPDLGMFPMRLDSHGYLQPQDSVVQAEEVREAGRDVERAVKHLALKPFDRTQAANFARFFEKRSARTAWPADLFHPEPGGREETKTIPLPNGARGTVRVTIDATTQGSSGLVDSFVRKVTSELDGDSHVTEETWTLSAKG